ncbi:MAG: PDZ domain-containing protein [Saprospiraceae bacterium]|nr:PDZ domain-containing protein [Saprospiraceae bacterium]MCB9328448.1 PDZ domain-containing protein [Lewinellaceae bacterium]
MNINFKILIGLIIFASSGVLKAQGDEKLFEISKNIEIFVNTYKSLNENYVDDLDPSELMRTGIDAMVKSLDPYTNFISESQVESYRIVDDAKYEGVGCEFEILDNTPTITTVYNNSPALTSGLLPGDKIMVINGLSVEGKSKIEIEAAIRGLPGTKLIVGIQRGNDSSVQNIEITRGEWMVSNVPYYGIIRDDIGYINLSTFTANAAANIKNALDELKKEDPNLKGLILDLRNNGGGLLREALAICNLFVPKGEELVTTKAKDPAKDQSYKTMNIPEDLDIPLVVLVNKRSASASEIVSGVIQDLDRGVIVGHRTYGKGLVQNTQDIGYNNRLKTTISRYYIPSQRCIQGFEYENGEPVDISDDKRSKFKTKNGRIVLDGGGITPDVKTEEVKISPFTQSLIDKNLIFYYVNDFVSRHDSIVEPDKFEFVEYPDFVKFVKNRGFAFSFKSEKEIKNLETMLQEEQLSEITKQDIQELLQKINSAKSNDFFVSKEKEIVDQIEQEIVSRYYFENGKIRKTLSSDSEVTTAVDILKDKAQYNRILGINN